MKKPLILISLVSTVASMYADQKVYIIVKNHTNEPVYFRYAAYSTAFKSNPMGFYLGPIWYIPARGVFGPKIPDWDTWTTGPKRQFMHTERFVDVKFFRVIGYEEKTLTKNEVWDRFIKYPDPFMKGERFFGIYSSSVFSEGLGRPQLCTYEDGAQKCIYLKRKNKIKIPIVQVFTYQLPYPHDRVVLELQHWGKVKQIK